MATYRLFGLRLESALDFPELPTASPGGEAVDVKLSIGSVGLPSSNGGTVGDRFHAQDGDAWFIWPEVATVRITGGNSIELQPTSDADPAGLRAAVLGPVFSVLLLQRGLYPLHASSVVIDGVAVAFASESGGGKTTLALALQERGHEFLSDDVTALDAGDPILARAAYPQLKLTPELVDHRGDDRDAMPFANPLREKHVHRLSRGISDAILPLGRVYIIEPATDGEADPAEPAVIRGPLDNSAAFFEALRHGHRVPLLERVVGQTDLMQRCSQIASRVPFYSLRRQCSLDRLDALAQCIEEHVRS